MTGLIPIAINGGLSHFNAGHSTIAQRVWTMTWLAIGWWISFTVDAYSVKRENFSFLVLYAAQAIGGFVVVTQMLLSYGRCIEISRLNV